MGERGGVGGREDSVRGEEGKADVWWNVNYDSYCLIKMILYLVLV